LSGYSILLACLPFVSTGLGGLAALRYRDSIHLLVAYSAGAVVGVVLFDVLPEIFGKGGGPPHVMLATGAAFLGFHVLERLGHAHDREEEHDDHVIGAVSAAALSAHSFIDGLAIGVGFQADARLGTLIAIAVVTHDFADGLNTVTVVLAHGGGTRRAARWLFMDMVTPLAGAVTGVLIPIKPDIIPWFMAAFAGTFLYVGASDLLPETHQDPSPWSIPMTIAGMATLFGISVLAQ
jgi:ZIP family zinc transporter